MNWPVFKEVAEVQRPRPILAYLGSAQRQEADAGQQETEFVCRLEEAPEKERLDMLKSLVRRELSAVLGRPEDELRDSTGFFDLGMDSLMAVEFRNRVQKLIGRKLPAGMIMDYSTAAALAGELVGLIGNVGGRTDTGPTALGAESQQSSRYVVGAYATADKPPIKVLFEDVWGPATAENAMRCWDWKYDRNPFIPPEGPVMRVLHRDGGVVGTNGGVSVRFKLGPDILPGIWGAETQIHPQHKMAMMLVTERLMRDSESLVHLGTPNDAAYKSMQALGLSHDICWYVNRKAFFKPGGVLAAEGLHPVVSALCGALAAPVTWAFRAASYRPHAANIAVNVIEAFDQRFDTFWNEVSKDYPAATVRDREFLSWRFVECPNRQYTISAADRDGRLCGYMVIRDFTKRGRKRGLIVDYLVKRDDTEAFGVLLGSAMKALRNRGVDMVTFSLSPWEDRRYRSVLIRYGFLFRKRGLPVVNTFGYARDRVREATDWLLTRADGDWDVAAFEDEHGREVRGGIRTT